MHTENEGLPIPSYRMGWSLTTEEGANNDSSPPAKGEYREAGRGFTPRLFPALHHSILLPYAMCLNFPHPAFLQVRAAVYCTRVKDPFPQFSILVSFVLIDQ